MSKIDLTKLHIEKLSDDNLSLTEDFDCRDLDLNEFLKEDALDHQKEHIAVTYLCFYEENLVGYFTWLTDAIEIRGRDKRVFRKIGMTYRTYPAIKIGRLAIDKRYRKQGIGSYLLKTVISNVLKYSEDIGCRYITVDAYPRVKDFYGRMNFKIYSQRKNVVFMYLDIEEYL